MLPTVTMNLTKFLLHLIIATDTNTTVQHAEGPVIGLIGDAGSATPKNKVVVDDGNDQIEVSIDVSGTSVLNSLLSRMASLSLPQTMTSTLALAAKSLKTCTLMALHT